MINELHRLSEAIKKADVLPNNFIPDTANTIATSSSEIPIYIFFEDATGTMYYYTAANTVYMNAPNRIRHQIVSAAIKARS